MRMKWACVAIAGLLVLPMSVDAAKRGKKKKVVVEEEEEYEEEGVTAYEEDSAGKGITFSIGQGLLARDLPMMPNGVTGAPNPALRVGYRLNQLIVHGTVDYVSYGMVQGPEGYCVEKDPAYEKGCKSWASSQKNMGLMTIGAGARYMFSAPAANTMVSYATGTLLFAVPLAGDNNPDEQTKLDKTYSGTSLGLTLGWGAEYFFSDAFSVGGEAGLSHVQFGLNEGNSSQMMTQVYTSVLFNFYL